MQSLLHTRETKKAMFSEPRYRILFLSTGNTARSIFAETSFEWWEKAGSRLTAPEPIPFER